MSKKKYSEKKIGEIVRQYEEGVSPGQLEKIHGIHHRTIEGWIIKYKINGLSAFQEEKHNRHYSEKIKQQAVEDYLKGEGSQQAIAAKYGLRDRTQIHRWIKVYNSGRGFPVLRIAVGNGSRTRHPEPGKKNWKLRLPNSNTNCI